MVEADKLHFFFSKATNEMDTDMGVTTLSFFFFDYLESFGVLKYWNFNFSCHKYLTSAEYVFFLFIKTSWVLKLIGNITKIFLF